MSKLSYYYALRRRIARPPIVLGPLRTLRYDDQDYSFFTYAGTWFKANHEWPGGSYQNTVTHRAAVVPTEALPTLTTQVITFGGDPSEGIAFWGAAEDSGQIRFFMRALDSETNSDWVPFGAPFGTYCLSWVWRATAPRSDDRPEADANYDNNFMGQSYYSRLGSPGLVHVHGMPAGRYQFMVQKPANTTDPNDNGDKALYFDGATVYTRDANFA
ncbi:MAG TPA: hypothetical protein VFO93_11575 [Hymenobacter sp.]|uniref:hypothetical protein n=1 Tax=Hymenobacter sp. TaxID=1898978 RepID=UPI002D7EDD4F|nr:hypothetical protein [Hymenobacter sp.]HET9504173.1 hypothetical protein [Hymenobacter sp.]